MTSLASFRNCHAGATIVVCGCGASLNELEHPEQFITIGVNDVGRKFQPDYLVVVNPRNQFKGDRFQYVESSQARHIFTQLDLGIRHAGIVRFRLGQYGGTDLSDPEVLHYTRNSPYVALGLAALMGAKRIGLIGVDFTDDHFFGATGRHPLASSLEQINKEYTRLGAALNTLGIEVWNLGSSSRMDAFPKASVDTFGVGERELQPPAASPLKIVSYATTPLAGVPIILARCIRARTAHKCRCVWARNGYGNGVCFEREIQWTESPAQAVEALEDADVVVLHNGKVDPAHAALIKNKPVVTMAHNYSWNVDDTYVRKGFPGLVVGQYQATLPEFSQWTAVPNPVPFWEEAFKPQPKPGTITICYTPSGKHERYAPGDRLYWHAKGYATTMRVLDQLAARFPVRLEVIRNGQVSHAESLAMKRRSHIVIDECVTGSYHRNSLEGLATGCVVVNGVGLLPEVNKVILRCAPGSDRSPFVFASLESLDSVLSELIERGADALARAGELNRLWFEQFWDFSAQWTSFWQPAIEGTRLPARLCASHVAPLADDSLMGREAKEATSRAQDVSVVVPHGGGERLPLLCAVLASLKQMKSVGEIIIVELGSAPLARRAAEQWADKYLFIEHAGLFERARALNAGTAIARHDVIVWHDNDLLLSQGFISHCCVELQQRGLDFLVPYSEVNYLSESDSLAVICGERPPGECKPVNALSSTGARANWIGCIGATRRDFIARHGGLIEGFRGWGGEDDAWFHKARTLGRIAATARSDQRVYHLYHTHSGGYNNGASSANPHYSENVALLRSVRSTRTGAELREKFPPAAPATGKHMTFACRQPSAILEEPGVLTKAGAAVLETRTTQTAPIIEPVSVPINGDSGASWDARPPCRNVFACLVHENQDCVIDLVRNLRYYDASSIILLYNGGDDADLLKRGFPFERYGAVIHPAPNRMRWGSLHGFALDCMRFCLANFSFDTVTIVDSDQLAVGINYSAYLGDFLRNRSRVGMLGNSCARQPASTRVAPAAHAWREIELWRPFLRRFDRGEEKFIHWTFWPSTVFTAAAARDLVALFDISAELREIMSRSKIWATEELILPTIIALLGYDIAINPCSFDYVKFKCRYSLSQIEAALSTPEIFWIHPVARRCEDTLRKYIRARSQHYHRNMPANKIKSDELLPIFPILARMKNVEGWLEEDEADLLAAAAVRALTNLPKTSGMAEVGSYCGRSTVVLGSVAKAIAPSARIFAIDPHDGKVGAADQGIQQSAPTFERFQKNIADAGLSGMVDVIRKHSYEVSLDRSICLLLIDGLHDYANVARDFYQFERSIVKAGYIAFHDYAPYYPGVQAFVNEILASEKYRLVAQQRSLIVVQKLA